MGVPINTCSDEKGGAGGCSLWFPPQYLYKCLLWKVPLEAPGRRQKLLLCDYTGRDAAPPT